MKLQHRHNFTTEAGAAHGAETPASDCLIGFSLLCALLFPLFLMLSSPAHATPDPLLLGIPTVIVGEQQIQLDQLGIYLEKSLHRPVSFVQRRSYQKFLDMFEDGRVDAGWLDGAQYMSNRDKLRPLAVGVWQGKPAYRSYLIVPDNDQTTRSIADLQGKIFGYSDPESNSGHHVPVSEILKLGADPETFFSRTLYTHSHIKLIKAVAAGLVNGARVDGYLYEQMRHYFPGIIARTRLVAQSDDYGFPPMVARANLPEDEYLALRDALLNMHQDAAGRQLLGALGLDRFIPIDPHLYDSTAALYQSIHHSVATRGGVHAKHR